jgi:hypothetical protein
MALFSNNLTPIWRLRHIDENPCSAQLDVGAREDHGLRDGASPPTLGETCDIRLRSDWRLTVRPMVRTERSDLLAAGVNKAPLVSSLRGVVPLGAGRRCQDVTRNDALIVG